MVKSTRAKTLSVLQDRVARCRRLYARTGQLVLKKLYMFSVETKMTFASRLYVKRGRDEKGTKKHDYLGSDNDSMFDMPDEEHKGYIGRGHEELDRVVKEFGEDQDN
ncbi:hypothetical protein L202_06756 [Cryptococcus amylolentus CBS 6039]|uniref:Uncharacterized protein n=2 Tax=Cryptococcus amylolentus TaxID=104669 RepID=A0A1E3HDC2_9TREE|nr:hypothetical protein L202_06756 [Cryptococcus amylolentus CBS 6039]ODN74340.1 hypothetical protein L202_06756 [Cryptococcus amylolentus CBS 6039]ODO01362.1 hypothetical protein I350_06181 [Cryptococcus amylolentus CBS 6273]